MSPIVALSTRMTRRMAITVRVRIIASQSSLILTSHRLGASAEGSADASSSNFVYDASDSHSHNYQRVMANMRGQCHTASAPTASRSHAKSPYPMPSRLFRPRTSQKTRGADEIRRRSAFTIPGTRPTEGTLQHKPEIVSSPFAWALLWHIPKKSRRLVTKFDRLKESLSVKISQANALRVEKASSSSQSRVRLASASCKGQ